MALSCCGFYFQRVHNFFCLLRCAFLSHRCFLNLGVFFDPLSHSLINQNRGKSCFSGGKERRFEHTILTFDNWFINSTEFYWRSKGKCTVAGICTDFYGNSGTSWISGLHERCGILVARVYSQLMFLIRRDQLACEEMVTWTWWPAHYIAQKVHIALGVTWVRFLSFTADGSDWTSDFRTPRQA